MFWRSFHKRLKKRVSMKGCIANRRKNKSRERFTVSNFSTGTTSKDSSKYDNNIVTDVPGREESRKKGEKGTWFKSCGIGSFIDTNIGRVIKTRKAQYDTTSQVNWHDGLKPNPSESEEAWFDSTVWLDSESDEEYKTVYGGSGRSSFSLPENDKGGFFVKKLVPDEDVTIVMGRLVTSEALKGVTICNSDIHNTTQEIPAERLSNTDMACRMGEHHLVESRSDDEKLRNQHGHSISCLPGLWRIASLTERKQSHSLAAWKRKTTLFLSTFNRKPADCDNSEVSFIPIKYVKQPVAGSQVPLYDAGKSTQGCWSRISSSTFKVRGQNYLMNKNKVFASDYAAFEPFAVDVFLSVKKINHIAQFVKLPGDEPVGNLPPLLVVNIQIPMYPAPIFLGEGDGEGFNLVLYFRISNSYANNIPVILREIYMKIIDDEVEKVKTFTGETDIPWRERLKIMGRVVNPEELQLSGPEKKILLNYNEKPVLSRPQHQFYKGTNYLEIDLDVHRFSYMARKGVSTFREQLKYAVLDLGFVIQANRAEELPEHVLCCVRLYKLDLGAFPHLFTSPSTKSMRPSQIKDDSPGDVLTPTIT